MCFRFFWLCGSTVNAQGVVGSGGRRMAERVLTGGTRIPEVEVTSTLASVFFAVVFGKLSGKVASLDLRAWYSASRESFDLGCSLDLRMKFAL